MNDGGHERTIKLPGPDATLALGRRLGLTVYKGDVIFLSGDLGAGKTTLARGLIEAAVGETDVPSPTYNIVQIYPRPDFDVWHLDLYRLKGPEEAFELGLEEAFGVAACLVEWPERLQDSGLTPGLSIRLTPDASGGRIAYLRGGPEWEKRLAEL